jgi:hypothetical protein
MSEKVKTYDSPQKLTFLVFITHLLSLRYILQNVPISTITFTNYSVITGHLLMTCGVISHTLPCNVSFLPCTSSIHHRKNLYIVGFNFCDSYCLYTTQPETLIKVTWGQIKCVTFITASKWINLFKILSWKKKQNYLKPLPYMNYMNWVQINTFAVKQAIKKLSAITKLPSENWQEIDRVQFEHLHHNSLDYSA